MGPLSYVYGYRGGAGRRGVGQDTTGDDGIKIRARDGRYELILWRCAADFVPKSAISENRPISEMADLGTKTAMQRHIELISPDWCPNFVAGVISTEDLRPIPPL